MGARLVLTFSQEGKPAARFYDHWAADNAADAASVIEKFFSIVANQDGPGISRDAARLALQYGVWRALHYAKAQALDFSSIYLVPHDVPTDNLGGECTAEIVCSAKSEPVVILNGAAYDWDAFLAYAKPYRWTADEDTFAAIRSVLIRRCGRAYGHYFITDPNNVNSKKMADHCGHCEASLSEIQAAHGDELQCVDNPGGFKMVAREAVEA